MSEQITNITMEDLGNHQPIHFSPVVSIITVVYNGERTLLKCIQSVANQTYENIEYIIIDGNSTDQTLNIIKNNREHVSHFLSEKDSGIYDAMNKGISLSTGQWIFFLGSDDFLLDENTISEIFSSDNSNFHLLIGRVLNENKKVFVSAVNWKTNFYNTVHHQSAFYKKDLFNEFNYDTRIKVVADYELNFIISFKSLNVKTLEQDIAFFSTSGLSGKHSDFINAIDYYRIRKKYINFYKNMFFSVIFFFHVIRKKTSFLLFKYRV